MTCWGLACFELGLECKDLRLIYGYNDLVPPLASTYTYTNTGICDCFLFPPVFSQTIHGAYDAQNNWFKIAIFPDALCIFPVKAQPLVSQGFHLIVWYMAPGTSQSSYCNRKKTIFFLLFLLWWRCDVYWAQAHLSWGASTIPDQLAVCLSQQHLTNGVLKAWPCWWQSPVDIQART